MAFVDEQGKEHCCESCAATGGSCGGVPWYRNWKLLGGVAAGVVVTAVGVSLIRRTDGPRQREARGDGL